MKNLISLLLELASILRIEQIPYWKNNNSASIAEVTTLIKEFNGVGIREITDRIGIIFFGKDLKIEKDLIFNWQENLISCKFCVLKKSIKEINETITEIAIKRTLTEIKNIINYVSTIKICNFEQVVKLRGTYLVRNEKNSDKIHEPFAILENQGQPDESYRRIDCYFVLPLKTIYASQEILTEKIKLQRKKITSQNKIIHSLQIKFQQKIKEEKEKVSTELDQIIQKVTNKIKKNEIDISSLNPIFQEFIKIQSEKKNRVRYHPIQGDYAAYEIVKSIIKLPSISTTSVNFFKRKPSKSFTSITFEYLQYKRNIYEGYWYRKPSFLLIKRNTPKVIDIDNLQ
ncbi:hypothetical protein Glove_142g13 [Diversispora epigaea]|uniref:Uncharacterized protein n=1 Tax=Diversispora epigaea TaxID=1348612 RepID=A0A397IUR7_9GLOM|nr:hypothetical protein Glove_142g15 [Diversispora epigaea]RHZ79693.1 hypothetical protein Glove_142g13 [Diversispora epigaea]